MILMVVTDENENFFLLGKRRKCAFVVVKNQHKGIVFNREAAVTDIRYGKQDNTPPFSTYILSFQAHFVNKPRMK